VRETKSTLDSEEHRTKKNEIPCEGGVAGVLAFIFVVARSISFGIDATVRVGAVLYLFLLPAALTIGFRGSAGATDDARATALAARPLHHRRRLGGAIRGSLP